MNDLYNVSEVKLTYESNNKNKKKLKVNSSMKNLDSKGACLFGIINKV